jgi:asparagine synthase (glutamine-hydrolysing)
MCGIYGYLSPSTIDPAVLRRMGQTLKHRGPDDEGEVILDSSEVSVGLGHKRLSVIDLSPAGKQPMTNEDETIWITFNGEIYNFQQLRKELEDFGYTFRSRSDTEVMFTSMKSWGRNVWTNSTVCSPSLSGTPNSKAYFLRETD